MQRSALCRSRRELSNAYFLAKIGFDTAENEPFNFHTFSSLQGFNFHRGVVSGTAIFTGSTDGFSSEIEYARVRRSEGAVSRDDWSAEVAPSPLP